jgi:hypothetical protein
MRKPLLFILAMLLPASMAVADPCAKAGGHVPIGEEELFAKASAVFIARVYRVEEVKVERAGESSPPITTVEGTFRLEEVLKGAPPADNKLIAVVRLGCGLPLLAGLDYLLFLARGNTVHDGGRPGSNVGASLILKREDGEVVYPPRKKLDKLREMAKQQQK